MIKARPCAGDIAAGEAFPSSLSPFIVAQISRLCGVADACMP